MKKPVFRVGLCAALLLCALSIAVFAAGGNDPCDKLTPEAITKHLSLPQFSFASKRDVGDGLCEAVLKVNGDLLPVYVTDNYVIVGDMFRFRGHPTREKLVELDAITFRENKAALDEATAFAYTPSKPKSTVYYITDPDCPYCEKAKLPVKQFADENNVEIKVVLYPLPMHPNAREKAIRGICAKMTYQDYIDGKYEGKECKEGKDKIERAATIVEKLKVTGTPTFIGDSGQKVVGFSPEKLRETL